MAIDPYSLCPCGSGKKLKFCCSDIAGELEKAYSLLGANQPRAALQHVDRQLAKHPDRVSLLDLFVLLQLILEDMEEAERGIARLRAAAPESPLSYAYDALAFTRRGQALKAVSSVQDALERSGEQLLHRAVGNAILGAGIALRDWGDIVAARGHFTLYALRSSEEANRGAELLLRMNLNGATPLILRDPLPLLPGPGDGKQKKRFSDAVRLAGRGMWRRAAPLFHELATLPTPLPESVYNAALLEGWLGNREAFISGMRRFATLDVSLNQAVIAEALAQLASDSKGEPMAVTLQLAFAVTDADELAAKFAADKRIEPYDANNADAVASQATRPRATYVLMDRAPAPSCVGMSCDDASLVLAHLALYGKRTDKEAQLLVTTNEDQSLPDTLQMLNEIGAPWIGSETRREIVLQKPLCYQALSWRWRLPDDATRSRRDELMAQERRKAIFNRWTKAPQAALGLQSPADAAGQQTYRIPLLASVLVLEQGNILPEETAMFHELRRTLRLPLGEPIPTDEYPVDTIPLIYIARYDLPALDDAQLALLLDRAAAQCAFGALLMIAEEVIKRDRDDPTIQLALRQMIRIHPRFETALEWTDKAVNRAQARAESIAPWLVLKLEICLEAIDEERVVDTLRTLRQDHFADPEVENAVSQVLLDHGLAIQPRDEGGYRQRLDEGPNSPTASTVWTPNSAVEAPSERAKSPIWTP